MAESVEHIVNLPNSTVETFGCVQNFIYTGNLYDAKAGVNIPDYPLLMEIWKLATELKMAPLRSAVLAVMAERRQLTQSIPGTDLLKQAWKETEEGSGLRKMLIEWAAEHMRGSPDVRNTFAKSLPQEILSELVIVMSDLPNTPTIVPRAINKHYLNNQNEAEYESPYAQPPQKRPRKSEAATAPNGDDTFEVKHTVKKPSRKSEPVTRKPAKFHGRTTNNSASSSAPAQFANDSDRDLAFCRDLITRMLSGPGFWTRLVGHFKDPVDPVAHNAPNYFSVVKRPMDLKQIKAKMDRNEYASSAEFEADVRLIFQNCYEYWTQSDQVFKDFVELMGCVSYFHLDGFCMALGVFAEFISKTQSPDIKTFLSSICNMSWKTMNIRSSNDRNILIQKYPWFDLPHFPAFDVTVSSSVISHLPKLDNNIKNMKTLFSKLRSNSSEWNEVLQ
ncbi:putative Ankyrin repeat, bromo and BTB domain-containing protein [Glarea lozoyensis 74030]|uniref:Putative Ankyrin repeat, bromo and BTB domain-containing protein n=1 Tax=Glarea lozoyensis (strain ATCC 74030 / MF5533) TaxID=1104152 RepID=H0EVX0_GLAL7|nr:putative Ankyrin repeat, bromo and BTB domain-containing protein [Glarea lozoyensis 74030]